MHHTITAAGGKLNIGTKQPLNSLFQRGAINSQYYDSLNCHETLSILLTPGNPKSPQRTACTTSIYTYNKLIVICETELPQTAKQYWEYLIRVKTLTTATHSSQLAAVLFILCIAKKPLQV